MKPGRNDETQRWGRLTRETSARAGSAFVRASWSTRPGNELRQSGRGIFGARVANNLQRPCNSSKRPTVNGLQGCTIRKKVIGHRMRAILAGFGGGKYVRGSGGSFTLLQEPACEHGGGIFLHPLVKQGTDFLPDVGGVRKTGELKALQRILGSREKKLPRGLDGTSGHFSSVTGTARILILE